MKYDLITTVAKVKSKKKIYLGFWCDEVKSKIYSSKYIHPKFIVGFNSREKVSIENKIQKYEQKLYPKIRKILDQYHKTEKHKKYYSYILGKWMRRYLSTMLNRYLTLEKFFKHNKLKINSINLETYKSISPPLDSYEAIEYFDNNFLNDWIYNKALKFINFDKNIKVNIKYTRNFNLQKINKKNQSFLSSIYNNLNLFIQKFLSKKDKKFFIGTYMPLHKEAILNLFFLQFPKIWKKIKINYKYKSDLNLRIELKKLLIKSFPKKQSREFTFLTENLFDLMPSSYLENFPCIKNTMLSSNWPQKPDLIFTSNNFDTDEAFKFYLAEQKEKNPMLKYIVGQHGIGYNLRETKINKEIDLADKVFVWGAYKKNKNQIPGFILKSSKINYSSKGKVLIIFNALNYRDHYWDKDYFFTKNFENKLYFLKLFDNKFLDNEIILRLGKEIKKFKFYEKEKIKKKFPNIQIDKNRSIQKSYLNSKLIVHFYQATPFLETISNNIPSVMFIDDRQYNFSKKAKLLLKKLKKNNIIFNDPKKMYKFIESNYCNIEKWWYSKKTQKIINTFSKNFCRKGSIKNIVKVIK